MCEAFVEVNRMRRAVVIVLLAVVLLHLIPNVRADSTMVIPAGGYDAITWRTPRRNYMGLYGHFEVTNGTDITFFICNETAFNDWKDGQSIDAYEIMEDVISGDYEFLSSGSNSSSVWWYLVFDNTDSVSTTQTVVVDFNIDTTPPLVDCSVSDGEVLSGNCTITITVNDRFGIESIEYVVAASRYPSSFDSIRQTVWDLEGNSYTFSLDTEQMENGSYYISIVATDKCDNEQLKYVDFRVENKHSPNTFDIVGFLTNPIVVGPILLSILGFAVMLRRRLNVVKAVETGQPSVSESTIEHGASIPGDSSTQEVALEKVPVERETTGLSKAEIPVDIRVVAFIIGALALFAPIIFVIQPDRGTIVIDAMTWSYTSSDSYWWFSFMVDYLIVSSYPFTVWRIALVYQMNRYYRGRSSRRTTFLLAVVAEMVYVIFDLVYLHVIFMGYWGPLLTIPTPLMLVGVAVFLWMTPYPVPATPFDDQPEPDQWWQENTNQEDEPSKETVDEE